MLGSTELGFLREAIRNKYDLSLLQALLLGTVRLKDTLDLLQIPTPRLDENQVYNNGTKCVEEDIEDIEAP